MAFSPSLSRRRVLVGSLAGAGSASLLPVACLAAAPPTSPASATLPSADRSRDFDFLDGHWYAHNRRLVRPLAPGAADAWETFESVHDGVLLPNGFGVADDFRIPSRPDFAGLALQLYDEKTGQWQVYWYRNGVLTASLLGRFEAGVGVFEGPDKHEGQAIRTRYTWSRITAMSAHWEQAYSADEGRSWETNWVMTYRRTPE